MAGPTVKEILLKWGIDASSWKTAVQQIGKLLDDQNKKSAQASRDAVKAFESQVSAVDDLLAASKKVSAEIDKQNNRSLSLSKSFEGIVDIGWDQLAVEKAITLEIAKQLGLRKAAGSEAAKQGFKVESHGKQYKKVTTGVGQQSVLVTNMRTVMADLEAEVDKLLVREKLVTKELQKQTDALKGQQPGIRSLVAKRVAPPPKPKIQTPAPLYAQEIVKINLLRASGIVSEERLREEHRKVIPLLDQEILKLKQQGLQTQQQIVQVEKLNRLRTQQLGASRGEKTGLGATLQEFGAGAISRMMGTLGFAVFSAEGFGRIVESLTEKVKDFVKEVGPLQQVREQFEKLAAGRGIEPGEFIDKLRASTKGLVSDTMLYRNANTFLQSGIRVSQEDIIKLTQATVGLARAQGKDASQAVQTLNEFFLTGYARTLARVVGMQSQQIGSLRSMGREFTGAAASTIAFQQALAAITKQYAAIGEPAQTYTEAVTKLKNQENRVLEEFITGVEQSGGFKAIIGDVDTLAERMGDFVEKAAGFGNSVGNVIGSLGEIVQNVASIFGTIGEGAIAVFSAIGDSVANLIRLYGQANEGVAALGGTIQTVGEQQKNSFTEELVARLTTLSGLFKTWAQGMIYVTTEVQRLANSLIRLSVVVGAGLQETILFFIKKLPLIGDSVGGFLEKAFHPLEHLKQAWRELGESDEKIVAQRAARLKALEGINAPKKEEYSLKFAEPSVNISQQQEVEAAKKIAKVKEEIALNSAKLQLEQTENRIKKETALNQLLYDENLKSFEAYIATKKHLENEDYEARKKQTEAEFKAKRDFQVKDTELQRRMVRLQRAQVDRGFRTDTDALDEQVKKKTELVNADKSLTPDKKKEDLDKIAAQEKTARANILENYRAGKEVANAMAEELGAKDVLLATERAAKMESIEIEHQGKMLKVDQDVIDKTKVARTKLVEELGKLDQESLANEKQHLEDQLKEGEISGKDYLSSRLTLINKEYEATEKAAAAKVLAEQNSLTAQADYANKMAEAASKREKDLTALSIGEFEIRTKAAEDAFDRVKNLYESQRSLGAAQEKLDPFAGRDEQVAAIGKIITVESLRLTLEQKILATTKEGTADWFTQYKRVVATREEIVKYQAELQKAHDIFTPLGGAFKNLGSAFGQFPGTRYKGLAGGFQAFGAGLEELQQERDRQANLARARSLRQQGLPATPEGQIVANLSELTKGAGTQFKELGDAAEGARKPLDDAKLSITSLSSSFEQFIHTAESALLRLANAGNAAADKVGTGTNFLGSKDYKPENKLLDITGLEAYQEGGPVSETGPALLHEGEHVLTKKEKPIWDWLERVRAKSAGHEPLEDDADRLIGLLSGETKKADKTGPTIGPAKPRSLLQRFEDWYTTKKDYEGTLARAGRTPREKVADVGKAATFASLPMLAEGLVAAPLLTLLGLGTGFAGTKVGGVTGKVIGQRLGAPTLGEDIGSAAGGLVIAGPKLAGTKLNGMPHPLAQADLTGESGQLAIPWISDVVDFISKSRKPSTGINKSLLDVLTPNSSEPAIEKVKLLKEAIDSWTNVGYKDTANDTALRVAPEPEPPTEGFDKERIREHARHLVAAAEQSEPFHEHLYRGLQSEEPIADLEQIKQGDTYRIPKLSSFSTSEYEGKKFTQGSPNKYLLRVEGPKRAFRIEDFSLFPTEAESVTFGDFIVKDKTPAIGEKPMEIVLEQKHATKPVGTGLFDEFVSGALPPNIIPPKETPVVKWGTDVSSWKTEGPLPAFQQGGLVKETGKALVHAGEYVLPSGIQSFISTIERLTSSFANSFQKVIAAAERIPSAFGKVTDTIAGKVVGGTQERPSPFKSLPEKTTPSPVAAAVGLLPALFRPKKAAVVTADAHPIDFTPSPLPSTLSSGLPTVEAPKGTTTASDLGAAKADASSGGLADLPTLLSSLAMANAGVLALGVASTKTAGQVDQAGGKFQSAWGAGGFLGKDGLKGLFSKDGDKGDQAANTVQGVAGFAKNAAGFASAAQGQGGPFQAGLQGLTSGMQMGMAVGGPIGAVVGAGAGLITGVFAGKARKQSEKLAKDIVAQFNAALQNLSSGTQSLSATIQLEINNIQQAVGQLSGKKGGRDELKKILPNMEQQLAQLQQQQKQIIQTFDEQLNTLNAPQAYQAQLTSIDQIIQKYQQYIQAGGNVANANEFLRQSYANLVQNGLNTLNQDEQDAISNAMNYNDLLVQRQQLIQDTNIQMQQIMSQGVAVRQMPEGVTRAIQMQKLAYDSSKQLDQMNEEISVAQFKMNAEQQIFGLATTRIGLENQLVVLQNEQTTLDLQRITALGSVVGALQTALPTSNQAALQELGLGSDFVSPVTEPGLLPVPPVKTGIADIDLQNQLQYQQALASYQLQANYPIGYISPTGPVPTTSPIPSTVGTPTNTVAGAPTYLSGTGLYGTAAGGTGTALQLAQQQAAAAAATNAQFTGTLSTGTLPTGLTPTLGTLPSLPNLTANSQQIDTVSTADGTALLVSLGSSAPTTVATGPGTTQQVGIVGTAQQVAAGTTSVFNSLTGAAPIKTPDITGMFPILTQVANGVKSVATAVTTFLKPQPTKTATAVASTASAPVAITTPPISATAPVSEVPAAQAPAPVTQTPIGTPIQAPVVGNLGVLSPFSGLQAASQIKNQITSIMAGGPTEAAKTQLTLLQQQAQTTLSTGKLGRSMLTQLNPIFAKAFSQFTTAPASGSPVAITTPPITAATPAPAQHAPSPVATALQDHTTAVTAQVSAAVQRQNLESSINQMSNMRVVNEAALVKMKMAEINADMQRIQAHTQLLALSKANGATPNTLEDLMQNVYETRGRQGFGRFYGETSNPA